jgi:hypothetical protein
MYTAGIENQASVRFGFGSSIRKKHEENVKQTGKVAGKA